jgi:chromate transporter
MIEATWQILLSFGRIGLFSLGGGNAMLKLIQEECVENRGWLTTAEFSSLLGVSYVFPGLTAVKLSALIGLKVAGVPGMLAGVLALNLPGLVMAFALYGVITRYQDAAWLRKVLLGMQYGALALLAAALWALARPLGSTLSWTAAGLAVALFVSVALLDLSPFLGILIFAAACVLML